jgi:lantibiotic leader peptide-processing serine protease
LRQRHFGIRLLTTTVAAVAALAFAGTAAAERYLVVYDGNGVPGSAGRAIERAGGKLVFAYGAIGVAVAESSEPGFASELARTRGVAAVAVDTVIAGENGEAAGPPEGDLPNAPAADADTFSAMQWNMRKIQAPEAHAVTGGSPAVVVGVIDTGIDFTHPDLAQNIDFLNSVSCLGAVPDQSPAAWKDDHGHGTLNAGVIAAASNGIGIVGVAPNVRIAAIKSGNAANQFFAGAVICGLEWAASRQLDVGNMSFNVDGLVFSYCHTDAAQQALWKAVQRAVRHALNAGVTLVASAGNSNIDMAHPAFGNECVRAPSEMAGVITSTADALLDLKASYSNYGVGFADVVAPGGDFPQGGFASLVLSTWPSYIPGPSPPQHDPTGGVGATYRFTAGTSVAAAHTSGVAALVISRFGDGATPQNGKLRPGQVEALIERTADPRPCPPAPTTCQGGEGYNSWYGHGRVNAFRAITHDPGK